MRLKGGKNIEAEQYFRRAHNTPLRGREHVALEKVVLLHPEKQAGY
jgi:hypothetical protein